jgi:hypothetical protein
MSIHDEEFDLYADDDLDTSVFPSLLNKHWVTLPSYRRVLRLSSVEIVRVVVVSCCCCNCCY